MGENCVWGSSACVDAMGGCCLLCVGVYCVIASEAKQANVCKARIMRIPCLLIATLARCARSQ